MSYAKVAPTRALVIDANYDGLVANSSCLTQLATKIVTENAQRQELDDTALASNLAHAR